MRIQITSSYKRDKIVERIAKIFGCDDHRSDNSNMKGFTSIGSANNVALSLGRNPEYNLTLWVRNFPKDCDGFADTINFLI